MGNQSATESSKQQGQQKSAQKIILRLRHRDIILHYSFKMNVTIADSDIFPNNYEGLRTWDADIVLSRFIILENDRFRNKEVMVFKAGVGIAGVALSKWGGCKSITMCDIITEVVKNMQNNCLSNGVKNVKTMLVNMDEFDKIQTEYDVVCSTDLFRMGFLPLNIINIWRKLLKVGGEAFLIMPDQKDKAKKLMELVDRTQFKTTNLILTADEYEASPLFNKIEGETEFPQLGKSTFYVIGLLKLKQVKVVHEKTEQKFNKTDKGEKITVLPTQKIETRKATPEEIKDKPKNQKLVEKQKEEEIPKERPIEESKISPKEAEKAPESTVTAQTKTANDEEGKTNQDTHKESPKEIKGNENEVIDEMPKEVQVQEVKQSVNSITEPAKEEEKEGTSEEPKSTLKEERDESKEDHREAVEEETKEVVTDEPEEELKEESKEDQKEESKEQQKEELKEEQEELKEEATEEPKEQSKEEEQKEEPKEEPQQEVSKEKASEEPHEQSIEEKQKQELKEEATEEPKEQSKEEPKKNQKKNKKKKKKNQKEAHEEEQKEGQKIDEPESNVSETVNEQNGK